MEIVMNNQKNKILALMLGFTLLGGMTNTASAMVKKKVTKKKPVLTLQQQASIAGNTMIEAIRKQGFPSEYEGENIDYVRNSVNNFKNRKTLNENLKNLGTWLDISVGSGKSLKTEKSLNLAFTQFKTQMLELNNKAYRK